MYFHAFVQSFACSRHLFYLFLTFLISFEKLIFVFHLFNPINSCSLDSPKVVFCNAFLLILRFILFNLTFATDCPFWRTTVLSQLFCRSLFSSSIRQQDSSLLVSETLLMLLSPFPFIASLYEPQ